MAEELSGVTVVFIIAGGVLTIILLFIFAKRQIMRFALRSRRGPHVPVGHGAKKSLKKEIHRRVDLIPKIVYEPQVINDNDSRYILPPGSQLPPFYYRLKACDDVKLLEKEITKQDGSLHRHPTENLRAYLLNTLGTPLNGVGQKLVQQFCDLYEHARHDPADFGDEEYQAYSRILLKLMDAARLLKNYGGNRKMSPRCTPVRAKPNEKNREPVENKTRDRRDETESNRESNETSV
ncbi:hypothetical protein GE061_000455 [Apolygus lucorum]|uniref:Uncharacterized protein n=1 Tax=Apolygus lucorum TaxID=248454 RepID=A0A6A4KK05_APOLU|nr:hypothetical protein GE061_000455 [Apolygus lucorum]